MFNITSQVHGKKGQYRCQPASTLQEADELSGSLVLPCSNAVENEAETPREACQLKTLIGGKAWKSYLIQKSWLSGNLDLGIPRISRGAP